MCYNIDFNVQYIICCTIDATVKCNLYDITPPSVIYRCMITGNFLCMVEYMYVAKFMIDFFIISTHLYN